jgi:cellulose synthase operon protein C
MTRTIGALMVVLASGAALAAQTPAQWQDIIRNLRNPSLETRLGAVQRLAAANYAAAAEPVSALLVDPDDKIQLAALEAELTFFLADRVDGGRMFLGDAKSRAQQAFEAGPLVRAAAAAPPAVFDRLLMAMRDENPRVRFDAVHTLGLVAEAPLTGAQELALAAELDHYDPIIRAATARVLGRVRARTAATALLIAVDDTSEVVRMFAVEALGLMRDDRLVGPARGYAARGKGDLARASMLALARIGAKEDLETFREQLVSRDVFLRRVGAEGIGRGGDRESMPALERLAASEKASAVRLAAMFSLQLFGQTQTHLIASAIADDTQARQAVDYLLEIGPSAMPGIVEAVKVAVTPEHKATLAQLVGYLGGEADRALLEPLTKDRDTRVRRAATVALERLTRRR